MKKLTDYDIFEGAESWLLQECVCKKASEGWVLNGECYYVNHKKTWYQPMKREAEVEES